MQKKLLVEVRLTSTLTFHPFSYCIELAACSVEILCEIYNLQSAKIKVIYYETQFRLFLKQSLSYPLWEVLVCMWQRVLNKFHIEQHDYSQKHFLRSKIMKLNSRKANLIKVKACPACPWQNERCLDYFLTERTNFFRKNSPLQIQWNFLPCLLFHILSNPKLLRMFKENLCTSVNPIDLCAPSYATLSWWLVYDAFNIWLVWNKSWSCCWQ